MIPIQMKMFEFRDIQGQVFDCHGIPRHRESDRPSLLLTRESFGQVLLPDLRTRRARGCFDRRTRRLRSVLLDGHTRHCTSFRCRPVLFKGWGVRCEQSLTNTPIESTFGVGIEGVLLNVVRSGKMIVSSRTIHRRYFVSDGILVRWRGIVWHLIGLLIIDMANGRWERLDI